jgi:hypothetical protein
LDVVTAGEDVFSSAGVENQMIPNNTTSAATQNGMTRRRKAKAFNTWEASVSVTRGESTSRRRTFVMTGEVVSMCSSTRRLN